MKKQLLSLALILALLLSVCGTGTAFAEAPTISSKEMTFYLCSEEDTRTYSVYFIGDSDVPYVSLADWAELMPYLVKTYIREDPDCSFALDCAVAGAVGVLMREDSYTVTFDCDADTITFFDYDAFLRYDSSRLLIDVLSVDDPASADDVKLFRRGEGSYERYGDQLVLDLAAYGIDLVAESNVCYVPLQTLSDFMLTLSYVNALYNGEAVFFVPNGGLYEDEELSPLGKLFYSVESRERSEAMGAFSYAELCLAMDNLYGLKDIHGVASFDTLALQTGYREILMGTNPDWADEALYRILTFHLDDLHSAFNYASPLSDGELLTRMNDEIGSGRSVKSLVTQMINYYTARMEAYPEGIPAYEEVGNTAYITFDNFTSIPDDVDYYETAPTAEVEDTIGIILYAYAQITREDSPIENVVLDLSCNTGGSVDAAVFVISSFLSEGCVSVKNIMSGALATGVYQVDVNLDRRFDENDQGLLEKRLFCLTSPISFSCGNLVPNVFKNSNLVTLLGRTSGGGSCCVLPMSTAYGTSFQISGPMRLSFIKNGSFYDIDQGATPDFSLTNPASFYDRAALTEYINTLK